MAKTRLPVIMDEDLKEGLDQMADELNMSKNQLALIALYSLDLDCDLKIYITLHFL